MDHLLRPYPASRMRTIIRDSQKTAKEFGESGRFGRSGRHTLRAPMEAVMNAVNTEGREVITESGKAYWDDMKRRHPWIDPSPNKGGSRVFKNSGRLTRFGRSSFTKVYS